nr:hypothetical protein OG461_16595 [Streptomyces sp. NBC_00995]
MRTAGPAGLRARPEGQDLFGQAANVDRAAARPIGAGAVHHPGIVDGTHLGDAVEEQAPTAGRS